MQASRAVLGKSRGSRIWVGLWAGFGSSDRFASLKANVLGEPFPRQTELLIYLAAPAMVLLP